MALLTTRHRRRYIILSLLLSVLVILYITTGPSATTDSDFYRKTVTYMNERSGLSSAHAPAQANIDTHTPPQVPLQNGNEAAKVEDSRSEQEKEADRIEGMKSRLAEAASAAKKSASEKGLEMQEAAKVANANVASVAEKAAEKVKSVVTSVVAKATEAAATVVDKVEDKEKSVAGRKKFPIHEDELDENSAIKPGEDGVAKIGANVETTPSTSDAEVDEAGTPHGPEITPKEELKRLLSLGPMVIFSKSYCPYSKKAKKILLEQMTIEPAPTVVEFDQHPMGSELQSVLGAMTGRRTVPNVMVGGKSLGGGDDVEALMRDGSLGDKIMSMAGRKITRAEAKEVPRQMGGQ